MLLQILDTYVIKQKLRNLECPFCSYKASNFSGLTIHIRSKHPLDSCPVCGYKGTHLSIHIGKRTDEAHKTLYIIYNTAGKHGKNKLRNLRRELFEEPD